MKLRDLSGFRKKSIVRLLKKENPFQEYYVFTFSIPDGVSWRPGEHGIFRIPDVQGKKWRAFSVASTREDGVIRIATRISDNPSAFKERLKGFEAGDTIRMRGPFGWFVVRDRTAPIVGIAGGIGITPFRALLAAQQNDQSREIHLIYSTRDKHLFQEDFENLSEINPKISVSFVHGREAVDTELKVHASKYGNQAYYYLSGPFAAIQANRKMLKKLKISGNRMIQDPFLGYGKR